MTGDRPEVDRQELAAEHHRNACLDNHDEQDCVAIQLADEIERQQGKLAERDAEVERLRGELRLAENDLEWERG